VSLGRIRAASEPGPESEPYWSDASPPEEVAGEAAPGYRLSSRTIQIALGCLWLLDGLLQLQPALFGRGFAYNLNYNDVMSQPLGLAHLLSSVVDLVRPHLAIWNSLFASIELLIGAGLLFRRTVKLALLASLVWALLVWVFGEGLGGLFTGLATIIGGAPGPVLLYPLIGFIAWPTTSHPGASPSWRRAGGPPAALLARLAWALIWVGGALLQLQPSYPYPAVLASTFSMNLMGNEPGLLVSLDTFLTRLAIELGNPLVLGLAVAEAAVGVAVLVQFRPRVSLWVGAVLAILFWVGGQNFGGILTGDATDPGSGPLLVLLALTLLPGAALTGRGSRADLGTVR